MTGMLILAFGIALFLIDGVIYYFKVVGSPLAEKMLFVCGPTLFGIGAYALFLGILMVAWPPKETEQVSEPVD